MSHKTPVALVHFRTDMASLPFETFAAAVDFVLLQPRALERTAFIECQSSDPEPQPEGPAGPIGAVH